MLCVAGGAGRLHSWYIRKRQIRMIFFQLSKLGFGGICSYPVEPGNGERAVDVEIVQVPHGDRI